MTECFRFHSLTYLKFLWKKNSAFRNFQTPWLLMKWGCEYLYLSSLRHEDGWQKSLVKYFRRLGKGAYRNGNYYHRKSHNSLPAVIVTVENGDSFYFPSPLSQWMGISLLASYCNWQSLLYKTHSQFTFPLNF